MAKVISQNLVIYYAQPDGDHTNLDPLSISDHSVGDKTIPRAGREVVPGRNVYGRPVIKRLRRTAVGGLITMNVEWEKICTPEFLEKQSVQGTEFDLWEFAILCGRLDNLGLWDRLDFWGDFGITQEVQGASSSRDGSGTEVINNVDVAGVYHVVWVPWELSNVDNITETEAINSIDGLRDLLDAGCLPGYPGADMVLYCACDAASGLTANILYSVNGGAGPYTAVGSDPLAADEHAGAIQVRIISKTQYRVVGGRITGDASNPAEIFYGDFTFGAPGTTTWNLLSIGSTNNDIIDAIDWLFLDRMYISTGGDIWISTDWGESTEASAAYTGSNDIAGFAKGLDDEVWAFGATNTILRERGKSGSFVTRTGPSGGAAFTALAVAFDGTIYAGNGTALYVNNNQAENTGGWTQLHDFGANHVVAAIRCAGQADIENGSDKLLQVFVRDTSTPQGEYWYSFDGGAILREVPELTNTGLNDVYWPESDDNYAVLVGEPDATPLANVIVLEPETC